MVSQNCEPLFWNSASKNDNGDATENSDGGKYQSLCDDFIEKYGTTQSCNHRNAELNSRCVGGTKPWQDEVSDGVTNARGESARGDGVTHADQVQ